MLSEDDDDDNSFGVTVCGRKMVGREGIGMLRVSAIVLKRVRKCENERERAGKDEFGRCTMEVVGNHMSVGRIRPGGCTS